MSWFPLTRFLWERCNRNGLKVLSFVGNTSMLLLRSGQFLGASQLSVGIVLRVLGEFGLKTMAMASIITTFFGMVIALQVAKQMMEQGAGQFVGALVALAIVRELAPIMSGFSAIALVGSAFTAEIASQKMTEQLDGMVILRVSPVRWVALPRLVASLALLPMVNMMAIGCGIAGGLLVALPYIWIPSGIRRGLSIWCSA
jgi:phospholipid/cholesterol/gamma-HCH transport system permease protein